jgi:hypothetical protein
MANLALLTAARIATEAVDIDAGQAIHEDANGRWALASAANAAGAAAPYLATHKARAGAGLTGIRNGVFYGFNLSALAFNAPVYLSDTAGAIADTPGTVNVLIGRVTSARAVTFGSTKDKILKVDCPL